VLVADWLRQRRNCLYHEYASVRTPDDCCVRRLRIAFLQTYFSGSEIPWHQLSDIERRTILSTLLCTQPHCIVYSHLPALISFGLRCFNFSLLPGLESRRIERAFSEPRQSCLLTGSILYLLAGCCTFHFRSIRVCNLQLTQDMLTSTSQINMHSLKLRLLPLERFLSEHPKMMILLRVLNCSLYNSYFTGITTVMNMHR
jgi:hypothetical protein